MPEQEGDREFRVASNMERTHRHEVCELTEHGLKVLIGNLEPWQAYAIVAILDPPFRR